MKSPCFPVTRLTLVRGGVPYRTQRKLEQDVVPVHRQNFPLCHPLRATGGLIIEAAPDSVDPIPVHRQNFPLSSLTSPSQDDPQLHDRDSDNDQGGFDETDQLVSSSSALSGSTLPASVSGPIMSVAYAPLPIPAACCIRNERKIRGLEEYVGWFESSGSAAIERPSHSEGAGDGDVFIHRYGEEQYQTWIRSNNTWDVASRGYKHPYLTGYRLVLGKKPGWVTRKTINTYNYRNNTGSA